MLLWNVPPLSIYPPLIIDTLDKICGNNFRCEYARDHTFLIFVFHFHWMRDANTWIFYISMSMLFCGLFFIFFSRNGENSTHIKIWTRQIPIGNGIDKSVLVSFSHRLSLIFERLWVFWNILIIIARCIARWMCSLFKQKRWRCDQNRKQIKIPVL